MKFPANLKRCRKARGLTQEALGHATGLGGQSRIANYESGSREPTFEEAQRIADALGVTVAELLGTEAGGTDAQDIASILIAMCDLLSEAMPKAAQDLAKRIEELAGSPAAQDQDRLVGHALSLLRRTAKRPVLPTA